MSSSEKHVRQNEMANWTIREAQESDVDKMLELRLALREHMEKRNSRFWRLSDRGREEIRKQLTQIFPDADAIAFVAQDESGNLVGMITGRVDTNDRCVPSTTGSIGLLFVSESWRRRGIGTKLVRKLCQFFASRNIEIISVGYVVENEEAVQFWSKLGFQPVIITASNNLHNLEQKIAGKGGDNV